MQVSERAEHAGAAPDRVLGPTIQDSRGQIIPFRRTPTSLGNRTDQYESNSMFAFENFRALESTEVKQYILILIAVVALVLNAVFGFLNYLK